RERLPSGAKLSITGLPTWMESSELREVLRQVDYWIPQAYGAKIAENDNEFAAITTPDQVATVADGARRLGYPFYIGLPAYTYASLYSVSGKLVGLRGDIAPMELLAGGDFELLRRRPVPTAARYSSACAEERIGGSRYDFKARADTVIAGL